MYLCSNICLKFNFLFYLTTLMLFSALPISIFVNIKINYRSKKLGKHLWSIMVCVFVDKSQKIILFYKNEYSIRVFKKKSLFYATIRLLLTPWDRECTATLYHAMRSNILLTSPNNSSLRVLLIKRAFKRVCSEYNIFFFLQIFAVPPPF